MEEMRHIRWPETQIDWTLPWGLWLKSVRWCTTRSTFEIMKIAFKIVGKFGSGVATLLLFVLLLFLFKLIQDYENRF